MIEKTPASNSVSTCKCIHTHTIAQLVLVFSPVPHEQRILGGGPCLQVTVRWLYILNHFMQPGIPLTLVQLRAYQLSLYCYLPGDRLCFVPSSQPVTEGRHIRPIPHKVPL